MHRKNGIRLQLNQQFHLGGLAEPTRVTKLKQLK